MKTLFRALILAASLTAIAQAQPSPADVDRIFAQWDKPDSPGCALGVIRDGRLVYKRGYGSANLDYGIPLSSESVFYIASTSKQFTAASLLLLVRSGKLALADDVRKYIPELPQYERTITVDHLVHHTSGLRDYLELMGLAGRSLEDQFDGGDALAVIVRQKALNYAPGEQYMYSNSNYVLMAELVKRVSGLSLRAFAEENLFKPLGMTHSHFNDDRAVVVRNRVTSYAPGYPGQFRLFIKNINAVGDGNLLTTIEDLALWDRNFYDNRVGGPGFSDAMLVKGKLNNGQETFYGFGLGNETYRGLRVVAHGGAFLGFRTELMRFPEQRFSVVCLCNVSNANPTELAHKVADLYLADQLKSAEPASAPAPSAAPAPAASWAPAADRLAEYDGEYYSEELDTAFRMIAEDGKLYVKSVRASQRQAALPQTPDAFKSFGREYRFTRDGQGRVVGFLLNGARVRNLAFVKRAR